MLTARAPRSSATSRGCLLRGATMQLARGGPCLRPACVTAAVRMPPRARRPARAARAVVGSRASVSPVRLQMPRSAATLQPPALCCAVRCADALGLPRAQQQQQQGRSPSAQAASGGSKADKLLLQKALSSTATGEEVLQLCSKHADTFDHIHAATAANRLGLFATTPAARSALVSDPRAAALAAVLQADAGKLNAQGVANVLWGFARLAPEYTPPPALLAALERAASRPAIWKDASTQAFANAAWAYVRLGGSSAKRCEWHRCCLLCSSSRRCTRAAVRSTFSSLPPCLAHASSSRRSWRSSSTRAAAAAACPACPALPTPCGPPATHRWSSSSPTSWQS